MTTILLLPKRRPSEQSDEEDATNHWIKSTGRGRGVIFQATPQLWRTSKSRRSTGNGFMTTLALTFMTASGTTILGRGGGVTSRSCHHSAKMRHAGRLGDASWWSCWKIYARCGTDCGTRSGSSSFRRLSCNKTVKSPHPTQYVGGSRRGWKAGRQGALGCLWRRTCACARNTSPSPVERSQMSTDLRPTTSWFSEGSCGQQ